MDFCEYPTCIYVWMHKIQLQKEIKKGMGKGKGNKCVTHLFWFHTQSSQKAHGGQIKENEPGNMKQKLMMHQYMFNKYQWAYKCKLKWYVGSNKDAI